MKTTDPRVPDMLAMRQRGETLMAIGTKYGMTGERARQLLKKTNAPNGTETFAFHRSLKAAAAADDVTRVAHYLAANPGSTPDDVAAGLGLGAWQVRALARTAGVTGLLREKPTAHQDRAFRFSDDQILGALRAAAALLPDGAPLTANAYEALRPDLEVAPSVPLIYDRFESWIGACTRAGVIPGSPLRSYEKGIDDNAMLTGLAQFLAVSASVSVVAYDAWRAGRLIDVACSSAIRKRFGTWIAARGLAQDRMDTHPTVTAA